MSWELWLGLTSAAVSIAGFAWNRENVRKLAFVILALLGVTLVIRGVSYQRKIDGLQDRIVIASSLASSVMSADQLYESVSTADVTRTDFDDALNQAVEDRRVLHRVMDVRTPDNTDIRVRVYFVR